LTVVLSARVSYKGEQVLRCQITNETAPSFPLLNDKLDVWGVHGDYTTDIRVKNSNERQLVESTLKDCEVVIQDVEEHIRAAEGERLISRAKAEWFEAYHTYDELVQWYKDFAANNSDLLTGGSAGTTLEGRDQPYWRLYAGGNTAPQYTVYWQCQIHAREWISGATCNYIWNQLVADYRAGNTQVRAQLQAIQFILVPFTNPDGYVYTWTNDRLWRKNRRTPPTGGACYGVDVNRNYNDHWGQGGSSNQPCSETYMGPSVASERETQNTQNLFKALQRQAPVIAAIDWHSYSQLILRPYGWTNSVSKDETRLSQVGAKFASDIASVHGRSYTSQRSYQLYQTTGSNSDWTYGDDATAGNGGLRAAGFTVELRPAQSPPGFELPPIEIIPTGEENYAAVLNFVGTFQQTPLLQ